jgi:hypothetical protein
MVQMQQQQQRVEEPEPIDIDDDSFIEGKQLKKYVNSLKQELKSTKKQFEEYNQKSSFDQAELKLKSQFSDFDEIVNKDNLERLASRKPALYRSIMANGDIYDRGYTAYEMIRNSGVIEEKTSTRESVKIDKRLEENKLKPRSAASTPAQTGDSALTRVEDYDRRILSKERIELLRKHVEEAKRNR